MSEKQIFLVVRKSFPMRGSPGVSIAVVLGETLEEVQARFPSRDSRYESTTVLAEGEFAEIVEQNDTYSDR